MQNNITPKFAQVKINNKSISAIKTKIMSQEFWLKEELKQLYIKKISLNRTVYRAHLEVLNTLHPAIINNVIGTVNTQITNTTKVIIATHNKKFTKLQREQHTHRDIKCKHVFHKRVDNHTKMIFSEDEIKLLSKGFNYNLPKFNKNNLVREVTNAEAALKYIKNQGTQQEARSIINNKLTRLLKISNNVIMPSKHKEEFKTAKSINKNSN